MANLKRILFLALAFILLSLTLNIGVSEASSCQVPTPAYPNVNSAVAAGCTYIEFISDVVEPGTVSIINPSNDIVINGNGFKWVFQPTPIIRLNAFNNLGLRNITLMNLDIQLGSANSFGGHLRFVGNFNVTMINTQLNSTGGGYIIYFRSLGPVDPSPTLILKGIDMKVNSPLFSVGLYVVNVNGHIYSIAVTNSSFNGTDFGVYYTGWFGSDIDSIIMNLVSSTGSIYLFVYSNTDNVGTIYLAGVDVVLKPFGFGGIYLALSGYFNVFMHDIYVENRFGFSLALTLPTPGHVNAWLNRITLVSPTSSAFLGFYTSIWSWTPSVLNVSVNDIYISGYTYSVYSYTSVGSSTKLSMNDVEIYMTSPFGRGFFLYSFRGSSVDISINDAIVSGGYAAMQVYALYEGSFRIKINEMDILGPPNYGFLLYNWGLFPLYPGLTLQIDGYRVNSTGASIRDLETFVFGSIGPSTKIIGEFKYSILPRFILRSVTQINFTESVVDEFNSALALGASSYFKWTLGVYVMSSLTGLPVVGHAVDFYMGATHISTGYTGFNGMAGGTYEYWFNPADPKVDDVWFTLDNWGSTISRSLSVDYGVTYTAPYWYFPIYIGTNLLSLSAIGFSTGYGTSVVYVSGFKGWIATYYHEIPYEELRMGWMSGSGSLLSAYLLEENIPVKKIEFTVVAMTIADRFVYLTIRMLHGTVSAETLMIIDTARRVLWIQGPISYVGWF